MLNQPKAPLRANDLIIFIPVKNPDNLVFRSAEDFIIGKDKCRLGYHPAILLSLYIDSYLNPVQASRQLEKEYHRNDELVWLLGCLKLGFKTTADFGKNYGRGIKGANRRFIEITRQMNMFSDLVLVIDSSKSKL